MSYLTQFPTPPGGGLSLLAFKIAANAAETGVSANKIIIEIELSTSFMSILGLTLYDSTNTNGITENYIGLYYLDFGQYPQSQEADEIIIAGITGELDEKSYYTSSINGKKYARKGAGTELDPYTYYSVEPVRWLVIGNGSDYNGWGFPDVNGFLKSGGNKDFGDNQLLLLSEKMLIEKQYHSNKNQGGDWIDTDLYKYLNNSSESSLSLLDTIFSTFEQTVLGTFEDVSDATGVIFYSKLSILSSNNKYQSSPYLYPNRKPRMCSSTDFGSPGDLKYWLRFNKGKYAQVAECFSGNSQTSTTSENKELLNSVRPIILFNL